MKKWSFVLSLLALLFLIWGVLWVVTIFKRGERFFPGESYFQSHPVSFSNLKQLKNEMGMALSERGRQGESALGPRILTNEDVILLWGLAVIELLVSFFYIVSSISLFRRYPFAKGVVWSTMMLDLFFKIGVVFYMMNIAVPLEDLYQNQNILFAYFYPHSGFWSDLSLYFSGLKIFQDNGGLYLLVYVTAVLLISFLMSLALTRDDLKRKT